MLLPASLLGASGGETGQRDFVLLQYSNSGFHTVIENNCEGRRGTIINKVFQTNCTCFLVDHYFRGELNSEILD